MLSVGATAFFFILLLVFTIHTIFLAYHWYSYGTSKHTSHVALATHLIGAAVFFAAMALLLPAI